MVTMVMKALEEREGEGNDPYGDLKKAIIATVRQVSDNASGFERFLKATPNEQENWITYGEHLFLCLKQHNRTLEYQNTTNMESQERVNAVDDDNYINNLVEILKSTFLQPKRPTTDLRETARTPPVCWNCGKLGHIQSLCRRKRKSLETEQGRSEMNRYRL
ncbi:hypothetical protein RF11_14161 [Thelohanellus kitauei]|uniref:CCHC-type domain-containing protein n=1 Tax=Thelohanellus kitauei TaxID=669202 RepID=A0A0C2M4C0_THEKT|nr:hypothetical protein RF11_14161 [Thelohanellus kitauei]